MKKALKTTQETAEKILKLIGIEAKVTASEDLANQAILVQLETNEPGILIGYHGETLAAYQLLLGIVLNKSLKVWTRVIVNVGDYREKREETLHRMALNAAQRAHFSGSPVILPSLSPGERRIIHLALKNNTEVETYSEGEGPERRLVIRPR